MTSLLADVPNPLGIITDPIGSLGGWAFEKVADGIAKWVLDAVEFFVNGAIDFLRTSSTPDVSAAWFSGSNSPYAAVRNVAAFLIVGFVFLGIIHLVACLHNLRVTARIGSLEDLPNFGHRP